MLKRHFWLLVGLLIFASCADRSNPANPETPMSLGNPDATDSRMAWELMRLKNPATGEVPQHIRKKELRYAETLPKKSGAKSLNWDWRGPRNRGGRTRALAIDVRNSDIVLAGGVTGGMWRSTDGANTWLKATALNDLQSVSSIIQDTRPGKEDTWYYGTGENYGVVSGTSFSALLSGDGIFKSTDNGQSWTQLASTVVDQAQTYQLNGSFKQVNRIVIDPTDTINDIVLAAVYNGIARSTDGGQTWTSVLGMDTTSSQEGEHSDIVVSPSGVFYASIGDGSSSEGLFRSVDGVSWTKLSSTPGALFPGNADRTVLALDPQDENKLWFLVQSTSSFTGVNGHILGIYRYLTGDGAGANGQWETRTSGLPQDPCLGYFTFNFGLMNTQSGYDMDLTIHPQDSNIIYVGGINVWRSTNGFRSTDSTSWIGGYKCTPSDPKDYVYDNHHPDIHRILFQPNDPSIMWTASDGGVHRTLAPLADSVIWEDMNTGYATSQFYTVHLEEGDPNDDRVIGGTQDNGTFFAATNNVNDDWFWVHRDDGAYAALPNGASFILTSSQAGRLYKKELDANNQVIGFERIDPLLGSSSYNFINQFVLDPRNNNKLYWVSATRIWRNEDLAGIPITNNWYDKIDTNWELLSDANLPGSQRISTLDISYWQRSLFYGTQNGRIHRLDDLDSASMNRTEITGANMPSGAYVSCVAPNDHDPDEWMATFSNYGVQSIWHTSDGGNSWTHVGGNLEQNSDGSGNGPAVFWASIYPESQSGLPLYFVGTSVGLFSTDQLDGDNTVWAQEGPNTLGSVPINMIATRAEDGTIAVATHGNGIYGSSLPAAPVGISETLVEMESTVFPNPSTDQVNIALTLQNAGSLNVEVYSSAGQLVQRLHSGNTASGVHTYVWNLRNDAGSSVSDGTYLINIISKGQRSVKRIIVAR